MAVEPAAAAGGFWGRGISGPRFDILIASLSSDLLFASLAGSIFFTNNRMPNAVGKQEMSLPEKQTWKTRLVERAYPDRSFDIEFWQGQGDEAIFAAAWEMVELAEEIRYGRKPALQRTVTALKRI